MKAVHLTTKSEKETVQFGVKLSKALNQGDIVCLEGDLGSGKTTLVKGIAKGFGIESNHVNSPTFVLMNIYEGKLPLYHFDLYRLHDLNQIQSLDCEEYLYGEGISLIEWAEKLANMTPKEYLKIKLKHKSEKERSFSISARGKRYAKLLSTLS